MAILISEVAAGELSGRMGRLQSLQDIICGPMAPLEEVQRLAQSLAPC